MIGFGYPSVSNISITPAFVSTPLTNFKQGWDVSTVDDAAQGTISELLNNRKTTYGSLKHCMIGGVVSMLPEPARH